MSVDEIDPYTLLSEIVLMDDGEGEDLIKPLSGFDLYMERHRQTTAARSHAAAMLAPYGGIWTPGS